MLVAGVLLLAGVAWAAGRTEDSVPSGSGSSTSLRLSGAAGDPHSRSVIGNGSCAACHESDPDGGYPFVWAERVSDACMDCHAGAGSATGSGGRSVASGHAVAHADSPGTVSGPSGGLECVSCHTFHGGSDAVVNGWTRADEGKQIWWQDPNAAAWSQGFLHQAGGSRGWQVCESTGVRCSPAQVLDAQGQLTPLYGYKLLSARPGGSGRIASYGTSPNGQDQASWCGACHSSHMDASMGGASENHPGACSACHGNPASLRSNGFPHSSAMPQLLKRVPDELCVSCHTKGSLS